MIVEEEYKLFVISIPEGDIHFKQYGMDNRAYCRINGKWKINSGGSPLDWVKAKKSESLLLERKFQELFRKNKLQNLENIQ